MTWVPPYALEECRDRLNESFDGVRVSDGLTHLGLQFWSPTATGQLELVSKFKPIDDSHISDFREWAHAHDVRVMLCVYNGTSGWDWELASAAFNTHCSSFVEALAGESLRLQLDGVDIDLEGNGELNASKAAFVTFIKKLAERLHAEGKELTVDTFAYTWNAPNQNWWPELLPLIDGLNVMGYKQTGSNAEGWRAYRALKAAGGNYASKINIGMPGNEAEWQGSSVTEQLKWIVDGASVGLAIWDAQLQSPSWRTGETWSTIAEIAKKEIDSPRKQRAESE